MALFTATLLLPDACESLPELLPESRLELTNAEQPTTKITTAATMAAVMMAKSFQPLTPPALDWFPREVCWVQLLPSHQRKGACP